METYFKAFTDPPMTDWLSRSFLSQRLALIYFVSKWTHEVDSELLWHYLRNKVMYLQYNSIVKTYNPSVRFARESLYYAASRLC